MNIIESGIIAQESCIAIVVARFNKFINESLMKSAIDVLKRIGQVKDENITIVWVPGAYELPLAASAISKIDKYDAIIALGTIIRGSTTHFDYIANRVNNGLSYVIQDANIPITFGVLTTKNIEQAIERAGTKNGNKGAEAALAVLEMINTLKAIKNLV